MRHVTAVTVLSIMGLAYCLTRTTQAGVPSVPRQISIQSKVSDLGGLPISDGVHSATFAVFTASTGGTQIWTEGPLNITTAGGLFSHNLGSAASLPTNLSIRDSLWLQIVFDGVTLSPRIHLVSSPSSQIAGALEVRSPNGNFNAVDTDPSGRVTTYDSFTGKPLTRLWGVDYDAGGNEDGVLMLDAVDLDASQADAELTTYGGFGQLVLRNAGIGAVLGANQPGLGGSLQLMNGAGGDGITLLGGQVGDNAVVLPSGSISGSEIFDASVTGADISDGSVTAADNSDETGVASEVVSGPTSLTGGVEVIAAQAILAPTSGYVLAIGTTGASGNVTASEQYAVFGVSNVSNQFTGSQDSRVDPSDAAPGAYESIVTVHRVFTINAGLHLFYFLAQEVGGTWIVFDRNLTLLFIPTTYGQVDPPTGKIVGLNTPPSSVQFESPAPLTMSPLEMQRELAAMSVQAAETVRRLVELEAKVGIQQANTRLAKPEID